MIKKILGLFIFGLGILNFGFCVNISSDLPYFNYNGINKVNIDTYINLDDGDGNPVILFQSTYNTSNRVNYFYWWQDGKLYGYKADNYTYYKGALKSIILCDNNFENCGSSASPLNPENFYNGSLIGTVFNKILIKDQSQVAICFGNDNGSVCTLDNASFCNHNENNCGILLNGNTIESIINENGDNIQKYSPFNVEGGGENEDQTPGITPGSDESAIDYFEDRYGRDESICYVGIDNITTMYGSSVSFNQGTGLNIFEVYSLLYNNSDLDKVYVWLNTRLINYEQWFLRDNPLYLASYNSGTNKVNLYYENLTFPFANNPVALYFMASNITYHSEYSTMGSEVVSYCNIKINGGNFDDIIDPSVKNNINNYTEQSNKSKGFNPDGTPKVFSGFMDGTGSSQFLSGLDIEEYTGGISDFFDNSINQLKGLLDDGNPFTGVLPNWLIFGFLLVALFKILKHY